MSDEPHRNPAWENGFIREAAEGIDDEDDILLPYLHGVQERLEKGQEEYGPESYLNKILPPEITEEAHDGGAWAVLWAQQLRSSETLLPVEIDLIHAHIKDGIRHFILAYSAMQTGATLLEQFEKQSE